MQVPGISSGPDAEVSQREQPTAASHNPGLYTLDREGRHFRRPHRAAAISERTSRVEAPVEPAYQPLVDAQLDDLVFSWRRLRDPELRTLAIRIIQSMAV